MSDPPEWDAAAGAGAAGAWAGAAEAGLASPAAAPADERLARLLARFEQLVQPVDLARDPADPAWQDYCPNAATLTALNALPWRARSEW